MARHAGVVCGLDFALWPQRTEIFLWHETVSARVQSLSQTSGRCAMFALRS
jgi:hypothetical protein